MAISLLVRLVFLLASTDRDWPHSILYEGDAPVWVEWANTMDAGQPFEFDLPLRSPAVAYVLSWIHPGLITESILPFKILWCVVASLTAGVLFFAIRLEFNRAIAMIASLLYTFSFGSYLLATSLNNEALYAFELVLIALSTVRFVRFPTPWLAAGLAILHGIAMLTRAEHMLLLAMMSLLSLWMLRKNQSGFFRNLVAVSMIVAGSIVICLPWSIHGSLATQRFNTVSPDVSDFAAANPPWSDDARADIERLPAFAQDGNFRFISYLALMENKPLVTREFVQDFFTKRFAYVPEPLPHWTLISLKGPLDFALANHPDANGGFSKAALAQPGETDPTIMFGRPDHLKLFNHGYSIGLEAIRQDFSGWLARVRMKLDQFARGASLGFTSRNLPLGLHGERRSVDIFVPDDQPFWKWLCLSAFAFGAALCMTRRAGCVWLIIVAYKIIVVVLFYGYARQAVSILPAFFVLAAVSLNQVGSWSSRLWNPSMRLKTFATIALLAGILLADITGSIWRPFFDIAGNVRFTPRWGEHAFESHESLRITAAERKGG